MEQAWERGHPALVEGETPSLPAGKPSFPSRAKRRRLAALSCRRYALVSGQIAVGDRFPQAGCCHHFPNGRALLGSVLHCQNPPAPQALRRSCYHFARAPRATPPAVAQTRSRECPRSCLSPSGPPSSAPLGSNRSGPREQSSDSTYGGLLTMASNVRSSSSGSYQEPSAKRMRPGARRPALAGVLAALPPARQGKHPWRESAIEASAGPA